MGFFRDFREDLSESATKASGKKDSLQVDMSSEDIMVNTLDEQVDEVADLSSLSASFAKELEESEEVVAEEEEDVVIDPSEIISDEIAVITAGTAINGDLTSDGSIDVLGCVTGNVTCRGKLTVCGAVYGDSKANEIFVNSAEIEGDIEAKGSIKIGQGTVIVGNITATSAVIAGAVKGNIDVKGPVIIDSTAVIAGDIMSKSVQINNGAAIDGRCSQCYAEIDTATIFDIKTRNKK